MTLARHCDKIRPKIDDFGSQKEKKVIKNSIFQGCFCHSCANNKSFLGKRIRFDALCSALRVCIFACTFLLIHAIMAKEGYTQNDVSGESASQDGQAIPYTESYATGNCGRSKSVSRNKDRLMSLPLCDHRGLYTRRHASYHPDRYARNGIFHSQLILSG